MRGPLGHDLRACLYVILVHALTGQHVNCRSDRGWGSGDSLAPTRQHSGRVPRMVVTNGLEASHEAGYWQVPKKDLVGTLQVLLQDQRLKIAAQMPEVPTLVEELLNFRLKPAPVSTDPLAAWQRGHRMIFCWQLRSRPGGSSSGGRGFGSCRTQTRQPSRFQWGKLAPPS